MIKRKTASVIQDFNGVKKIYTDSNLPTKRLRLDYYVGGSDNLLRLILIFFCFQFDIGFSFQFIEFLGSSRFILT